MGNQRYIMTAVAKLSNGQVQGKRSTRILGGSLFDFYIGQAATVSKAGASSLAHAAWVGSVKSTARLA